MNRKIIISAVTATVLGTGILAATNVAHAFNMGNMMDPGEWFDDDDDYYRYGRGGRGGYGGYGPYGYGGPYGGYGGPYGGYGGPYGGYPGYGGGYGGGYGQPSTIVVNPSSGADRAPAPPPPRLPE